jgi:hypothetical protein
MPDTPTTTDDDGLFLQTARDAIDHAQKDPTYKATMALISKMPGDRPRRMVERLTIRAYAQGSATARRFLAELRRTTKDTPDRELESQVEVALRIHADECTAELRDLWDLATAAQPGPGRELATVQAAPLKRVGEATERIARLAEPDDETWPMAILDLGTPGDGDL